MDLKLRILERQAEISGDWESYARNLSRILLEKDSSPIEVWFTTEHSSIETSIFMPAKIDIFLTEEDAMGHILTRYCEIVGVIETDPSYHDPNWIKDYKNFLQLLQNRKYREAWELFHDEKYGEELIEDIPRHLFALENYFIRQDS